MNVWLLLLPLVTLLLGAIGGLVAGLRWQTASAVASAAAEARSAAAAASAVDETKAEVLQALVERGEDSAVIRAGLDRLVAKIGELEAERARAEGQLAAQIHAVRSSNEDLRRETGALASALRRPQVRGQWGELHLRKVVEAAGMSAHCDFSEQVHIPGADGAARPDLVVNLAGGRKIVVDAKTPLDSFLDALDADEADRGRHLEKHARTVRGHIEALSRKAYWNRLDDAVEMVVLFVPSDACLAAAMETDRGLLEFASERKVALVSPTSLIGMLRAIAHGWRAESVAEAAREIQALGAELYSRLGTMGGHFDKLGRSLASSVDAYNKTVASFERRVIVTARKFEDMHVAEASLPEPTLIEATPQQITAPELIDELLPSRDELDFTNPHFDTPSATQHKRGDEEGPFLRSTLGA